jgi:hypothetical protein
VNGAAYHRLPQLSYVRVYSCSDAGTLLRTWGTQGSADGQFELPLATALARVDSKLFVLDCGSARVQVFE